MTKKCAFCHAPTDWRDPYSGRWVCDEFECQIAHDEEEKERYLQEQDAAWAAEADGYSRYR